MATILELEARMRPGASSLAGFLGPHESLVEVLKQDDAAVVSHGLTHNALASALETVLRRAVAAKDSSGRPLRHWEVVGPVEVHTQNWLGNQNCPWPECFTPIGIWGSSMDWVIRRQDGSGQIAGPGLIVHLIREHHFYEGHGSPYRVDPIVLARTLTVK